RVSEAAIEFENAPIVPIDHETGKQQTSKRNSFSAQPAQQWLHNVFIELCLQVVVPIIRRTECTHPACIGSAISIEGAFVVAGGRKQTIISAIDQSVERTLRSTKKFLDYHAATRFSKTSLIHHRVNRGYGTQTVGRNNHPLPQSEAVGLYHNWKLKLFAMSKRLAAVGKSRGSSSRNPFFAHQFLGKNFRRLEARSSFAGTKNARALLGQKIDNPKSKRIVRSDDGKIDVIVFCESGQRRQIARSNRNVLA